MLSSNIVVEFIFRLLYQCLDEVVGVIFLFGVWYPRTIEALE